MLLFRRSLLCLVVGVTTFGVAGWGLRPRARWGVELPAGGRTSFVKPIRAVADGDPIWLINSSSHARFERDSMVFAYSSADGALLKSAALGKAWKPEMQSVVLPDGRFVANVELAQNGVSRKSHFQVIDPKPGSELCKQSFDGEWNLADDGLHAWQATKTDGGFSFECRDLTTGQVHRKVDVPKCENFQRSDVAYSAVADVLAICEAMRDDADPPFGIELREGATGQVVRTVRTKSDDPIREPPVNPYFDFQSGGALLHFFTSGGAPLKTRLWTADVADGAVVERMAPAIPQDLAGIVDFNMTDDDCERQAWALNRLASSEGWLVLVRRGDPVPMWRRIPFPLIVELAYVQTMGVAADTSHLKGAQPRLVPGKPQLVVRTAEKPLSDNVPESFREHLPASWRTAEQAARFRWHDWESDDWRDVGVTSNPFEIQVRPQSLLTLSFSAKGIQVLESWPLPPRDPKWPALGIAAACTAATWWVCARRYARRLNRGESHRRGP